MVVHMDSSALTHAACERHMHNELIEGLQELDVQVNLVFGTSVHLFAQTFIETKDANVALRKALSYLEPYATDIMISKKPYFTPDYLTYVCTKLKSYIAQSSYDTIDIIHDGKKIYMTELPFSFPVYKDGDLEIVFEGTIDRVCKHITTDVVCIRDWKTTSLWDKEAYLASAKMLGQLRIYMWALNVLATLNPKSVFGYINQQKIKRVALDVIFLKPKIEDITIKATELFSFTDADLLETQELVYTEARKLANIVKSGKSLRDGMIHSACTTKYGLCKYFNLCSALPETVATIKQRSFTHRPYRPLTFRD